MVQRLTVIIMCLFLVGCSNKPPVNLNCEPIMISKDDRLTNGTAQQILIQNETIEATN